MKNLHISASNILGSILSDNIWGFKPVNLTKMGTPKFKLDDSYDWVIELKPKNSLMGLLFNPFVNPDKMLRVVGTKNCSKKKWVRLFTPLERLLFDIDIVLVNKKRVDAMKVSHSFSISGVNTSASYDCIIEAEVDALKFYNFLSFPRNDIKLNNLIASEISRFVGIQFDKGKNIRTRLEGEIHHELMAEYGYKVKKVELIYLGDKIAA